MIKAPTTDDVLARLGLQTQTTTTDYLLPALGVFGVGVLVGAGVALLLAPKSGPELRQDIGRTATRLKQRIPFTGDTTDLDAMSRDDLYARAKELQIEGRSDMTKAELLDAINAAS